MAIDKPFGSLYGAPLLTQFAIPETEKLAEGIEGYTYRQRSYRQRHTSKVN